LRISTSLIVSSSSVAAPANEKGKADAPPRAEIAEMKSRRLMARSQVGVRELVQLRERRQSSLL
jgi:hypothetical protein